MLHALNNEFAAEHETLQNDMQKLQQRCTEYEKERAKGCKSCRSLSDENDYHQSKLNDLTQENEQLANDINMMKILIYRLNVQLENYQEVVRKKGQAETNEHHRGPAVHQSTNLNCNTIDSIDWGGIDSNVLSPLLNAYQEIIREKTNLVRQYETELSQMTGRLKDIVCENEKFCEEVENLKQENETWSSEKVRLQAQLDVCR